MMSSFIFCDFSRNGCTKCRFNKWISLVPYSIQESVDAIRVTKHEHHLVLPIEEVKTLLKNVFIAQSIPFERLLDVLLLVRAVCIV